MVGGSPSYYLVVVSDSVARGERRDENTPLARRVLSGAGRKLRGSRVVGNDVNAIRAAVLAAVEEADIVLVAGGTGPSPRDVTIEAVEALAVKRLPGLGEELRRRSLASAGPRALLSRSEAYVLPGGKLVFAVPGSPGAVEEAIKLLLEIDEHLVEQLRGGRHRH